MSDFSKLQIDNDEYNVKDKQARDDIIDLKTTTTNLSNDNETNKSKIEKLSNDNETNKSKIEKLSNDYNGLFEVIFPVGYTFMDINGEIDYSNHLGLTWKKTLKGVSPIGQNEDDVDFATVGTTGGEKTHTLSVAEMPEHKHTIAHYDSQVSTSTGVWGISNTGWGNISANTKYEGICMEKAGNSQPHNNLHPYQVVTFWTRIA